MKKNILVSLLVLAIASVNTFAQNPAPAAQKPMANMQHPMADAPTRAQKFTNRITKALNLDAATSKKVYDAYLIRTQKVDEIQASSQSGKDKNTALKANKDTFETTLKGILSADQFDSFSKMEAEKKDHNREKGMQPQSQK